MLNPGLMLERLTERDIDSRSASWDAYAATVLVRLQEPG